MVYLSWIFCGCSNYLKDIALCKGKENYHLRCFERGVDNKNEDSIYHVNYFTLFVLITSSMFRPTTTGLAILRSFFIYLFLVSRWEVALLVSLYLEESPVEFVYIIIRGMPQSECKRRPWWTPWKKYSVGYLRILIFIY